jgi:hypothetical protein
VIHGPPYENIDYEFVDETFHRFSLSVESIIDLSRAHSLRKISDIMLVVVVVVKSILEIN